MLRGFVWIVGCSLALMASLHCFAELPAWALAMEREMEFSHAERVSVKLQLNNNSQVQTAAIVRDNHLELEEKTVEYLLQRSGGRFMHQEELTQLLSQPILLRDKKNYLCRTVSKVCYFVNHPVSQKNQIPSS